MVGSGNLLPVPCIPMLVQIGLDHISQVALGERVIVLAHQHQQLDKDLLLCLAEYSWSPHLPGPVGTSQLVHQCDPGVPGTLLPPGKESSPPL